MQVTPRVSIEVMLDLTEQEARWLQAFIQNYPGNPEDEDTVSKRNRKTLFEALQAALTRNQVK